MTQTKVANTKSVKPVQVRTNMAKNGLQPGDKLPKRSKRQKSYPPLTKAQQQLVQDHLWVAGRLAQRAKSLTGGFTGSYTKDDLESVALLALCTAASRFNPSLGWKFSTYAWTTCRGWIQHALRDHSRLVRVPRWIGPVRAECRDLLAQGLTYEEVAEELGLDEKQVLMCEESWKEIHYSYDHSPEDSRPNEFVYEVDEIKAFFGQEAFKEIGDLSDKDIHLLLMHVEGLTETPQESERAETLLAELRSALNPTD